ncbi:MAG: uridine kinase [Bacteroidota bacterium]
MPKPYIIGITGGSGSGKTTLINDLTKSFDLSELCLVSQDNYYRPKKEQKVDEQGITNFDLPESIDHIAFERDIQKLIEGQSITLTEYVYNNKEAVPKTLAFHPAPVLILEGIFIFHFPQIANFIDLKVFIEAKENLKIIRRIIRDQKERNYPIEDVLYRYQHHVSPTYEKYILPYKEHADLIINNNTHFHEAVDVLEGFIRNKLLKTKAQ